MRSYDQAMTSSEHRVKKLSITDPQRIPLILREWNYKTALFPILLIFAGANRKKNDFKTNVSNIIFLLRTLCLQDYFRAVEVNLTLSNAGTISLSRFRPFEREDIRKALYILIRKELLVEEYGEISMTRLRAYKPGNNNLANTFYKLGWFISNIGTLSLDDLCGEWII